LGFSALSNSGTLDLAAGTLTVPAVVFTNSGIILADEGASTITGQTSFANSGTIDLQDGGRRHPDDQQRLRGVGRVEPAGRLQRRGL
jgi:hypothetical protein